MKLMKVGSFAFLFRVEITAVVLILLALSTRTADSSRGDRDFTIHRCKEQCHKTKCNGTEYKNQLLPLRLLGWDCEGECQYSCMWETVGIFQQHDLNIPQFYGKWPFVRVAGIQEPASVIASLLNLLAHVFGILRLRKRSSPETPLYWFWHVFAVVCINGWIWSTVFHTRDMPMTEAMDYFSAFSMVAFSFFAAFTRMFEGILCMQVLGTAVAIASFFCYHVYYLAFIKFDYGYNMKANIVIGVLNALVWLVWCWKKRRNPHVRKCAAFIGLALASISLEVLDFPPIFWTFDSHALWHFSSALITPLWYSFLVDDCQYLHAQHAHQA